MNWARFYVARRSARSFLAVGALATMLAVLWFIGAPNYPGPMFGYVPPAEVILLSILLPGLGVGGAVFGLAWMWRIYQAPTKDEGAHWRFRDH
jgi:hypothetical protein